MTTNGRLIQKAIDLAGRNLFEPAFVPLCDALDQTARKIYENDNSSPEPPYQKFTAQNWRLISFMGIPPTATLPPNLPFGVRRAVASFSSPKIVEEIIVFAIRQTLATRRMPLEIGFNDVARFAVENDKLLLPQSLFFALVGGVVLHPANKNETIPDKYWLHIRDFKWFVSELWGRADLAVRIMEIYSD